VLKNFAILWTILMAIVSFSAMVKAGQATSSLDSDAARAGAGLGIMLGMGFLAAVWFVPTMGAAILGFLMKKSSIVETGPTGPLAGQDAPANFVNGWAGLTAFAVVGLILVISMGRTTATNSSSEHGAASSAAAVKSTTEGAAHTWDVTAKSDPMDGAKETSLTLQSEDKVSGLIGSHNAYLAVRCGKGKVEAYVDVGGPLQHEYGSDGYSVRIKFDDGPPAKSRWTASTDSRALFAPKSGELVKRLEDATVFLFEFTPFQQRETAIRFNVAGLREKLAPIAQTCGHGI
jgi:hypothetical protein